MNKAKRFFIISGLLVGTCLMTGCSGVNYTHGVSPANFLLPGLVHTEAADGNSLDPREDPSLVPVIQNL